MYGNECDYGGSDFNYMFMHSHVVMNEIDCVDYPRLSDYEIFARGQACAHVRLCRTIDHHR